jgi:spermidine synthase
MRRGVTVAFIVVHDSGVTDIVITESGGMRLLQFGTRWCQGAMRVAQPDRLELEYAVRMFAWLLFHDTATLADRQLTTIGLGAGSLTKFAHNVLGMRTVAVEIDAAVIDACRTHFLLPPDGERLQVVHADGNEYVAQGVEVDVLQVDAYDAAVARPALDSEAFYEHCSHCLRTDGTAMFNLVGSDLDLRASVRRIRSALRPQALWQFPPTQAGNVIVLAHRGAVPAEPELAARAAAIEARCDLPAPGWLAMARRAAAA